MTITVTGHDLLRVAGACLLLFLGGLVGFGVAASRFGGWKG